MSDDHYMTVDDPDHYDIRDDLDSGEFRNDQEREKAGQPKEPRNEKLGVMYD